MAFHGPHIRVFWLDFFAISFVLGARHEVAKLGFGKVALGALFKTAFSKRKRE
jgi:hypothetical protein